MKVKKERMESVCSMNENEYKCMQVFGWEGGSERIMEKNAY